MSITVEAIVVPLREDENDGLRIGDSRVQLDRLITAREQGATPEDIVDMYPSLALPDVYAVVAWMVRHPREVEEYKQRREQQAEKVKRQLIDAGVGREMTREQLEGMKARKGSTDVSPADG